MRGRSRAMPVLAVTLVVTFSVTVEAAAGTRAEAPRVRYTPPVDAPITDPFRAPAHRFAAGNRGVEYAPEPGTVVRAAGDGTVLFAGHVAGALHVTVGHADGLRTSYSFLAQVTVVAGQRVARGAPVGTSGGRVHFGVRDETDTYLDPQLLFDGELGGRARLVPSTEDGAAAMRRERAALLRLVLERGVAWAGARVEDARLLLHYAVELRPDVRAAHVVDRLARLAAQQRHCTPVGAPPSRPGRGRIAVLVAGLGSTSGHSSVDEVDAAALGFDAGDVLRFSYQGGLVPDPGDGADFAPLPRQPYGTADSTGDLRIAAARLRQLLHDVAAVRPGTPIDVIAHSQGGVVARLALGPYAGGPPPEVATLATIGTPHDGADLATAATAAVRTPGAVTTVAGGFAGVDPTAPAVEQLSETSPVVRDLRATPLPDRVHRVSIAARGDLVVPLPRTMDPVLPSAVVGLAGPDAHHRLPGAPETTAELALAIAGRPPTCATTGELAAGVLTGEALSWATDAAGALALAS